VKRRVGGRIAIQEDMLPGPRLEDRFEQAADLGVHGIEFWSRTLPAQVADIERLSGRRGVVAASVNHGRRSRFLDPDPAERARALAELREAMVLSGRIGAEGVIFVPHFFGPLLPDLSPYLDAVALERGLLSAQLNHLAVDAQAAGVKLFVEPVNRYETHLLVRLADAASLVRPLQQPNLGIVADLFHMALDEPDIPSVIRAHADVIGHVHLADHNRRLPGQGCLDFAAALAAIADIDFEGWMVFECGAPGENAPQAGAYLADLPASLSYLQRCRP
jgi:sugar phosphate isomerase/epimerase